MFKYGKRIFLAHLTLVTAPNELGLARAGVIVGTKIAKRAVVRNRLKRRVREALRTLFRDDDRLFRERPGLDMVLLPKQSSLAAPFTVIKKEIHSCFSRSLPNHY